MPSSKSRRLVAFQGERGAFSHAAARKLLGNRVEVAPCTSFRDVIQALETGRVTHAVLPIENTLHGSVHENYDNLLECDTPIRGETSVRIAHHLIAMPGVRFSEIRQVFSHPVALNQCRNFFRANRQLEPVSFYDTAGSVKMLREQNPKGAAAIASETAAETYGGIRLRRNIEDDRQNFTRFFLLTKQATNLRTATGAWKTTIVFTTPNVPGALFRSMACFALRGINLTKIESRPLRGKPWEYLFYVDLIGRAEDKNVQNALGNLQEMTDSLKILGSYRPTP